MSKPNPQGMKTNYKTRLNYSLGVRKDIPSCLTLQTKCSNYNKKCNNCVRIQGKYSEFKEK